MNTQQRKSGGALFTAKQKRTANSPDMHGDVMLTGEIINYILSEASRNSPEINLNIGGWRRVDRNGQPYIGLAISIPREREENRPMREATVERRNQYGQARNQEYARVDRNGPPYTGSAKPAPQGEKYRDAHQGYLMNDELPDFNDPKNTDRNPWD